MNLSLPHWTEPSLYRRRLTFGMSSKLSPTDSFYRGCASLIDRYLEARKPPIEDVERDLPVISVVTPVLNGESTIVETVESVLSQGYPRLEYTIVDGGSTDRTLECIAPFRSRFNRIISEPDSGMYHALKKGFGVASGDVFAYLNADDLYLPGALMRVGKHFRDNPRWRIIYFEDVVESDGWWFANRAQPHVNHRKLWNGHILYQDGVFFSREAFESVGGFNAELKLAGDWDLWTRFSEKYPLERCEGHASCFRIRSGQLSSDRASYDIELAESRERLKSKGAGRGFFGRALREVRAKVLNAMGFVRGRSQFYPIPVHQLPRSTGDPPPRFSDSPICPITGERPGRFLFSSQDTRFGDKGVHHWYLCEKSATAVCYPPLSRECLDGLYARNYSVSPASPPSSRNPEGLYADFRGESLVSRFVLEVPLPSVVSRGIHSKRGESVWNDFTADELLEMSNRVASADDREIALLDVGCFEGGLLEELRKRTHWTLVGSDPNVSAAAVAREKGFEIWEGHAEDMAALLPLSRKFDLLFLGQTIEHLNEPLVALRRLAGLLREEGRLIMSTPNLNSKQLEIFGPTWAHWHPPYHRHIFSLRALKQLGEEADLKLEKWGSYSHPYWSAMSLQLNQRGVDGFVPHGIPVPAEIIPKAESLAGWAQLLWNWRGRGDYLYVVYQRM